MNVWRDAAEQGAEREHGEPDLEDAASAEAVRHGAGEHEKAGEDERVGVDDPLELRDGGVELLLDGGKRDVHDGDVHGDEQQAHAADGEDGVWVGRLCGF